MQVNIKPHPQNFKPFIIELEVESEQEQIILETLSYLGHSIPQLVVDYISHSKLLKFQSDITSTKGDLKKVAYKRIESILKQIQWKLTEHRKDCGHR